MRLKRLDDKKVAKRNKVLAFLFFVIFILFFVLCFVFYNVFGDIGILTIVPTMIFFLLSFFFFGYWATSRKYSRMICFITKEGDDNLIRSILSLIYHDGTEEYQTVAKRFDIGGADSMWFGSNGSKDEGEFYVCFKIDKYQIIFELKGTVLRWGYDKTKVDEQDYENWEELQFYSKMSVEEFSDKISAILEEVIGKIGK